MDNELCENIGITMKVEIPELLTVKNFEKIFQWPTVASMRSYIYRAEEYGLEPAFIRMGKRVLVDHKKFFEIIRNLPVNQKKEKPRQFSYK